MSENRGPRRGPMGHGRMGGEKAKDFTFSTILTNHFGKRNFLRRFG